MARLFQVGIAACSARPQESIRLAHVHGAVFPARASLAGNGWYRRRRQPVLAYYETHSHECGGDAPDTGVVARELRYNAQGEMGLEGQRGCQENCDITS